LKSVPYTKRDVLQFSVSQRSICGDAEQSDDRLLTIETPTAGFFAIVADGLGGHAGGHVAAEIAVEEFDRLVRTHQLAQNQRFDFDHYTDAANRAIWQRQQDEPDLLAECRTTVVMLHIDAQEKSARWAHCGDSRLYHLRQNKIAHVTLDHTVAQMLVYDGELDRSVIPHHPDKNKLTRCFGGSRSESRPRVTSEPRQLHREDLLLLCSDGWWENLTESEIVETAAACKPDAQLPEQWLQKMDILIVDRLSPGADDRTACAIFLL